MHLTPVSSFTRQNLRAARQFTCQNRRQMHRLIHKAVEQQPSRTGGAAIESERKFVQIVIQMTWLYRTLVSPQQPTFQQRGHAIGDRQEIVLQSQRRANDFMGVTQILQTVVTFPSVGAYDAGDIDRL